MQFRRFRDTSNVAPSIRIDWSLYGGEESAPPLHAADGNGVLNATQKAGVAQPWMPSIPVETMRTNDFLWSLNEEPHKTRRIAILKAHPEVRKLMGHEPLTKYVTVAVVCLQVAIAIGLAQIGMGAYNWRFLLTAYIVGGCANQNLFLAIHEITHNLAFKGIRANRVLAIFANLPIGIPYAMMFKPYHIEHHKYLGEDGIDTDMPTRIELLCLNNVLGKTFFATFQLLFYALRPGFLRAQKLTYWHLLSITTQLIFNFTLYKITGSWIPLIYLILSSFFAGSLHPVAGHFIAEHYMFSNIQQETWSYYGPLNILAYNVGYHNEHHDFPSIPWTRLPALHKLASEFYDTLPCHTSWTMVILEFIFSDHSGLHMRMRRNLSDVHSDRGQAVADAHGHTGWDVRSQAS